MTIDNAWLSNTSIQSLMLNLKWIFDHGLRNQLLLLDNLNGCTQSWNNLRHSLKCNIFISSYQGREEEQK